MISSAPLARQGGGSIANEIGMTSPENRFTIFRLLQPIILHLDFGTKPHETRLIAELINGDPNHLTFSITQEMSEAFKSRIPLLDRIGDKAYRIKKFFDGIPIGQKFFIVPGHIDDELLYHRYHSILAKLNGEEVEPSSMDRIDSYLGEYYEVRTFNGDDRRRIGVNNKVERICRFCGKRIPDVHFSSKSHAISESLGNKGLICLEECDECNKRFNETIEQDLYNLVSLNLLLHAISGKKGSRALKGDGISIKLDSSSRDTLGRDTIVLTFRDMPNVSDPQEIIKNISKRYNFPSNKYVPQNIYKCLCKYVLSLLDSSEIPFFQETIAWINEPLRKRRLPPIWRYSVNTANSKWEHTTSMIIMRRKHNSKDIPYCWAIMIIAGEPYLFIVPFCSKDKYKFVGKTRQAFFIDGVKNMMNGILFHPTDMSDIKSHHLIVNQTFSMPEDSVEGRDYHIIRPDSKSNPLTQ